MFDKRETPLGHGKPSLIRPILVLSLSTGQDDDDGNRSLRVRLCSCADDPSHTNRHKKFLNAI